MKYINQLGFKTEAIFNEATTYPLSIICPSHNPLNLKFWLNNKKAFAVKWKYVLPYLDNKQIVSPYFKKLLRYLLFKDGCHIQPQQAFKNMVSPKTYLENDYFNHPEKMYTPI